jgi:hypothetical protein
MIRTLATVVKEAYQQASYSASQDMTKALQTKARSMGWGASAAGLKVDIQGTSINVTGTKDELEYGTERRAPRPAVRTYMNKTESALFIRQLHKALRAKGAL